MVIYTWFSIIMSFYIFFLISVDSSCRANIILQGLKNNLKNKEQPIIILTNNIVSIPKLKKKMIKIYLLPLTIVLKYLF